jgi:hypothetical protein
MSPGSSSQQQRGGIMTAVVLINVVFCALVVVGIVGSLAYSIVGHPPLRTARRRVSRAAASRRLSVSRIRQSMTRA